MPVVLAPLDGSARALHAVPWAAKLAGSGGIVLLLRAIPTEPEYVDTLFAFIGPGEEGLEQIRQQWHAVAQRDMDEAAALITAPGVKIERQVAEGEPDVAIVDAAAQRDVDMIAMASHGRGAIGRAIFGSVADRVARSATVPILILRTPSDDLPHAPVVVRRIVVPFDGSALAREALPVAASLARQLDAPVHVVRAIDPASNMPVAPGALGPSPLVTAEVTDRIWLEIETEARKSVADAVDTLQADGIDADGATLSGSPFFAISDVTEPDDLLVLTSHGRGGVGRWLLGSVAEKLIREAPAPVLLVPAKERIEGSRGREVE
jgi:nucleotide-binding universal stress UspA family protein